MRATIDRSGRLVIPKVLRDAIGLPDGGEVEIDVADGAIRLEPPTVAKRIEHRDGRAVIVADEPVPVLTDDAMFAAIDAVRDRR